MALIRKDSMTPEEVIADNPILTVFQNYGHTFKRVGPEYLTKCFLHDDSRPSLSVCPVKNKWFCFPCNTGGTVIEFIMHKEKCDFTQALEKLTRNVASKKQKQAKIDYKEVCAYDYTDENGRLLYQKVRYEPKTFKQRQKNSDGQWVWGMDGVRRVLYRLPEVVATPDLFLVEGEKDADSLVSLGFVATTNTEGSSQWLDSYSDYLKGKNVVVIPDNDDPGRKHAEQVTRSLAGKAAKIFKFEVPAPDKDISDFIKRHNGSARAEILKILDELKPINPVPDLPVWSVGEMESDYSDFTQKAQSKILSFQNWLPSLAKYVRGLVPGDVVVLAADTAGGKTTFMLNVVYNSGLPTLIFELELPTTRMFERLMQMATHKTGDEIFQSYRQKQPVEWSLCKNLNSLFFCTLSRMDPVKMEEIINKAELKMGVRPVIVGVDYMQLMQGLGGSRYERASYVAEQMKIIARSTGTIVIEASQVSRPFGKADRKELSLHELKDSGSLENSAGLVLGLWLEDEKTMKVKVMKNSSGLPNKIITCNYHGETMRITEQSPIDPADVPKPRNVVRMPYNENIL